MKLPRLLRRRAPVRRELSEEELVAAGEEVLMRIGEQLRLVDERPCELEPAHDWRSFDEMMAPFEYASSREVWELIIAWSASPIPGVRWHCERCRWHEITHSFVQRPTHCGGPMKPEATQWLQNRLDDTIADLSVALLFGGD
jgi:hypothetical protein